METERDDGKASQGELLMDRIAQQVKNLFKQKKKIRWTLMQVNLYKLLKQSLS